MRRRWWRRLVKVMAWAMALIVLMGAGLAWFAYTLVTDGDTAARLIKGQAARLLPSSIVEMGKVTVGIFRGGQVELKNIHLRQRINGQLFETASIPWLSVRIDPRQLVHGRFEPRDVIISQPTLRLCRRRDGTWNLQGLLASPWPAPAIKNPPPIVIRNGTVELLGGEEPKAQAANPIALRTGLQAVEMPARDVRVVRTGADGAGGGSRADEAMAITSATRKTPSELKAAQEPPSLRGPDSAAGAEDRGVAILRDVWLRIEPAANGQLHFEGSARGDLFERLNLEGQIDPATGILVLGGELAGLTLSENFRRPAPECR
jgi:hypothetical protein